MSEMLSSIYNFFYLVFFLLLASGVLWYAVSIFVFAIIGIIAYSLYRLTK